MRGSADDVRSSPAGPRASEALDNAELDFLIAPAGDYEVHAGEVLFEDTFTCVAWSGTRRGRHDFPGPISEAGPHGRQRRPGSVGNIDEVHLSKAKRRRRIEVSTPSFLLAPQLVVGTDRITTITSRLALETGRFCR